jgi:two-component system, NtrC family, sensor kinase
LSQGTLRQPLFVNTVVLTLLLSLACVIVTSFALVRATKRTYRRAAIETIAVLSQAPTRADLELAIAKGPFPDAFELAVVTSTAVAFGMGLPGARLVAASTSEVDEIYATRADRLTQETYVVARISPSVPLAIAFSEVAKTLPVLMGLALLAGLALAYSIGRLLLPQLSTLTAFAKEAGEDADVLIPSDAPNEVTEIARRFRSTIRQLHSERDKMKAQRDELARMQEGLVRASKLASIGRLAAGIAHEIGNPLAAVRGYLGLMQSGLEPAQEKDVLARSLKELGRIHETIKKLLTYARKGEDNVEPIAQFSTTKVLEEAIALVRGHPALRVVRIDHTGGDPERFDALGHPSRFNQVIVNLLLNAGQAMEGMEHPEITILTREAENSLEIIVSDNGPGIPKDKVGAIFDPFFTTKAPGEGTGLGLAVSKALMEAMNGDLTVESTEGQGASFTIRVPRAL